MPPPRTKCDSNWGLGGGGGQDGPVTTAALALAGIADSDAAARRDVPAVPSGRRRSGGGGGAVPEAAGGSLPGVSVVPGGDREGLGVQPHDVLVRRALLRSLREGAILACYASTQEWRGLTTERDTNLLQTNTKEMSE